MNLVDVIENIDVIEKEYIKLGFKTKKIVNSVSKKLSVNNLKFHFQFSYHASKGTFHLYYYIWDVKFGTCSIAHDSIISIYLYTLDFMENYLLSNCFLPFRADSYISKEREFKISALQNIIKT